jgi:DNA-directed RNA polymerase subunit alpha
MTSIKQLGNFVLPTKLVKVTETETPTFACFIAEPLDRGFGHTIGNALRRVLLSSLEGAAIVSIQIEGVTHEFQCCAGILEDVPQIILNLKKIRFKTVSREPVELSINVSRLGAVLAKDIVCPAGVEVVNPDQLICTLTEKNRSFSARLRLMVGRGCRLAEANKSDSQVLGVIPVDSLFSPIVRVSYRVESARVGSMTDFDKLFLEIETDGSIPPEDALKEGNAVLCHHLQIFQNASPEIVEFENERQSVNEEGNRLFDLLNSSVNELDLSVRAANCLNKAGIVKIWQLVIKTEAEMLKYSNFGKVSLNEIKDRLAALGLSLGMKLDQSLLQALRACLNQDSVAV